MRWRSPGSKKAADGAYSIHTFVQAGLSLSLFVPGGRHPAERRPVDHGWHRKAILTPPASATLPPLVKSRPWTPLDDKVLGSFSMLDIATKVPSNLDPATCCWHIRGNSKASHRDMQQHSTTLTRALQTELRRAFPSPRGLSGSLQPPRFLRISHCKYRCRPLPRSQAGPVWRVRLSFRALAPALIFLGTRSDPRAMTSGSSPVHDVPMRYS